MSRPLRVGIVGRRFGASVHAPAFAADPRCVVVGVAGRDDWRALLAGRPDALSIAVPPTEQPAIVIAAAENGTHVFCEKPAGASVAAVREALDAARAGRIVHGIDFLFPEIEAWQQARRWLASGGLGAIRHFAYTWRVETFSSRSNSPGWKGAPGAGGGALGNFVSHVLFNIEWLLEPITALEPFTLAAAPRAGRAVDGGVRLVGGATGRISVSTDAAHGCGHLIEVFGERGTLRLENSGRDYVNGFLLRTADRDADALRMHVQGVASETDGRVAAVTSLTRRFVDAITGGPAMTPDLASGLRVQQMLESIAAADGA